MGPDPGSGPHLVNFTPGGRVVAADSLISETSPQTAQVTLQDHGAWSVIITKYAPEPEMRVRARSQALAHTAGDLCAPHYVLSHPGSDLPARLMTAIDLRATPQVPAIDLP